MSIDSDTKVATLTGLAVGDALGQPFETAQADDPRLLAWDGRYGSSEYHKLGPGQWTDDTKMSSCIAESLLEYKEFNPTDLSRRYLEWYRSGDLRGVGKSTKKALSHLHNKVPWVHSGIVGAEGNGPAMRAAPIGLFYRKYPHIIVKVASTEARITHDSRLAEQGAIAVAMGVAFLAQGVPKEAVLDKVSFYLDDGPIKYSLLSASAQAKRQMEKPWEHLTTMGTKAHILQTVPAAYYAFLANDNYQGTVETAIRAGGDTDTTAAIAGALAGTHYGIEQVEKYLPELEDASAIRSLEQKLWNEAYRLGA